MKVFGPVVVAFLLVTRLVVVPAASDASDASNVSSSPDPLSTIVEGEAAPNVVASDTSSSPDPPNTIVEAKGDVEAESEAASQPSKNFGFGGFHFGGAAGDDGQDNGKSWEGDGYLKSTLKKYDDEGYDVKGTCAKMYPKPKLPDCDCRFVQDGELLSGRYDWYRFVGASAKDQCPRDTPGWKFDVCLKTSDDIEGTRGKVTLYSPSSCPNTQDKIECVIEKFRFAPTYPDAGDLIRFRASGRVFYDGNDGKGVQTHSCGVYFGRGYQGKDQLSFTIFKKPFEDLQQSWIYPRGPSVGTYRIFLSIPNGGPLLTSGSGDVVQDMKACGLPVVG